MGREVYTSTNRRTFKDDVFKLWGGAIDAQKATENLPKFKDGWTPGSYKYLGPYNPLEQYSESILQQNPEVTLKKCTFHHKTR